MSAQMFVIVRQVGEGRDVINVSAVIRTLDLQHHHPPGQPVG